MSENRNYRGIDMVVGIDTDQIACYDTHGQVIDCQGTGQDASFKQSAKTINAERFSILYGNVKDRLTGLIWERNANLAEFPLSWSEACHFVEQLNYNSKYGEPDGWRLPTREELFSLVSHQSINPSLPQNHPFIDVFNGYYWTGTTCARLPGQAWYVHLGGGRVYRGMKHGSYMVWPVRGKTQCRPSNQDRLTLIGNVYFDSLTAKMWYFGDNLLKKSYGWEAALHTINQLNDASLKGHEDWRLPNIRELESLVDDSRHSPALVQDASLGTPPIVGLWASTTSTYEPRYAWVLYIKDGAIGVGFKPKTDFHAIAVRG
jgi:hypothetical protein